jgi:type III secretion protein J
VVFLGLLLSACQEDLYSGLSQRAANEMVAVLAENDIKASRIQVDATNYKLRVSGDDLARSVRVLQATGYPKDAYRSVGEIFPGDGIIVTPYEQRARMSFALGQELSKTISEIDGVVSARVHVMLPDGDARMMGKVTAPSASVVVHQSGKLDPNEISQRVRLIVSNAVSNLSPRNVSVSVFQARNTSDNVRGMAASGPAGLVEVKSPFGLVLWILASLAVVAGILVITQRRKQPE